MTCMLACNACGSGCQRAEPFVPEDSLQYIAPSNGNWGLVRILCLVPESHILFVTPEACGRHTAFGALNKGLKDRVSYYFVSKEEITAGYDHELKKAAGQLLSLLNHRPKVLIVVVACIDDLIGTDIEQVMVELNAAFPDVNFIDCHMNPITGNTKTPPIVTSQKQMYSLLALATDQHKDRGVNLMGLFEPTDPGSDLYRFLSDLGIGPVRHISLYQSYDDFLSMAKSSYNFLQGPTAYLAAEFLEQELGTPYLQLFPSYRHEAIHLQYQALYQALCPDQSRPFPDLTQAQDRAETAIQETLTSLGNREIWLCDDSVMRPFELARMLVEKGFNLTTVIAGQVPAYDQAAADWLLDHAPDLTYIQAQHFRTVKFDRRNPDVLAIGFHAAYIADSPYVVPLMNDDFNFGYDGICRLMADMQYAASHPEDLAALIAEYGLVI